jgi:hypothetical protein
MQKIICSDSVPAICPEDHFVIEPLSFVDEVKTCSRFQPSTGKMAPNYLRTIAAEVGRRYDKKFSPYKNVVPTDYTGIAFHSVEEAASIVKAMFLASYPQIFESYLRHQIGIRSHSCSTIVLVGEMSIYIDQAREELDKHGPTVVLSNEAPIVEEISVAIDEVATEVEEIVPESLPYDSAVDISLDDLVANKFPNKLASKPSVTSKNNKNNKKHK